MKLCECGCGQDAGVYKQSHPERGEVKGTPKKFIVGHNGARRTWSERFWGKVNKEGPIPTHNPKLGRCWMWTAGKHPLGYGLLWDWETKKLRRATHVAIFLYTGEWPKLHALHMCDNPECVRFSHLEEGTRKKNMQDAVKRGLMNTPKGENAGKAKLTWAQVEAIRTEYAQGNITYRELAEKYGVNNSNIGCIVRGVYWKP